MDESKLIDKYLKKISTNNPNAKKLNDDVFFDKKNKLVVSVDTYNEGFHFPNFKNPNLVIKKIIRSSISDLYCKGVSPKYIFISGSGDKKHFSIKNLKLISKSINEEQKKFNILLSGGDTVNSKKSSFSVTTLGYSKKIVRRNMTNLGDDIYVTGNLGDSYIGLNILKKKITISKKMNNYFISKYYKPDLPVNIHSYLFKFATSSLDISDGLISDLKKLINEQKFGFDLFINNLPISKNLQFYLTKNNKKIINYVSRGDDYQIIFSSSKKNRHYIKNLSKRINQKITLIGTITNQSHAYRIINNEKQLKSLNYQGYLHKF